MNIFHTSSMEPEKFLTLTEFTALLKAAKDSRERCILLSLAGAGLHAREMTQIRAEDIDFPKGCLHIQALNSKGKKPRTVVLIPLVTDAFKRQLDDRTKGWLFPRYREEHISSRQSRTFSMGIATRAKLQEVKRKDKAGKDRHRIHLNLLRHVLLYGVSIVECPWEIYRASSVILSGDHRHIP
jgi:integrase